MPGKLLRLMALIFFCSAVPYNAEAASRNSVKIQKFKTLGFNGKSLTCAKIGSRYRAAKVSGSHALPLLDLAKIKLKAAKTKKAKAAAKALVDLAKQNDKICKIGHVVPPTPTPTATPLPIPPDESLAPVSGPVSDDMVNTLLSKGAFGPGAAEASVITAARTQGISAAVDALATNQAESANYATCDDYADGQKNATNATANNVTPLGQRYTHFCRAMFTNNAYQFKLAMYLLQMYPVDINTNTQADVQGWLGVSQGYVGYWDMLFNAAAGNIQLRDLLVNVGRHPRMLQFLNNNVNQFDPNTGVSKENENYAREVQQLFSLGLTFKDGNGVEHPSYVEHRINPNTGLDDLKLSDIARVASIFSGHTVIYAPLVGGGPNVPQGIFNPLAHNPTQQDVYAEQPFHIVTDKDDIFIQKIFDSHPAAAQFYASRLAQYYIAPRSYLPDGLLKNLEQVIKDNNFNLGPVVKIILKSEAFYNSRYAHSIPVDPFVSAVKMIRGLGMATFLNGANNNVITVVNQLDKTYLVNTPTKGVFGWDASRWSNPSVLPEKVNMAALVLDNATTAGWTTAVIAPGGAASSDAVIAAIAGKLGISISDPGVLSLFQSFMNFDKAGNGTLTSIPYDNTNATRQRKKVTGLVRAMSALPTFNFH